MSQTRRALPSGPLRGSVRAPGDKSVSHRSAILGAMARGVTEVRGGLEGADIHSTLAAVEAFGATVERADGMWRIRGTGVKGFRSPEGDVDCGNAGTGVRLLMGAAAGYRLQARFVGDASLSSRPMGRVMRPLREMGAEFASTTLGNGGDDRLPATLRSDGKLGAITHTPLVASAQVKSAVLLAGLHADGATTVVERVPTRDHTENMLRAFGASVETVGGKVTVEPLMEPMRATAVEVPGDPSSAAFAVVAALVIPGSDVTVEDVMLNPRRTALLDALHAMGAEVEVGNVRQSGGERVGDLRARHSELKGATIDPERAADMIDEYPVLAVAAAFADGETVMEGIGELRVKESDRIKATVALLRGAGVEVEERPDGMTVAGARSVAGGSTVETHHDHRIAMSALVLGLASREGVAVDDASMIATSYPDFFAHFGSLGARFE